jgi:saccharopine dehydrogenase-like NADP-dependent oxidoreductase
MVLSRGGSLINVSAMSHAAGERPREQFPTARGTVVRHAGVAPGATNLVAAELLAQHPEADEIELVFTVSMSNGAGRAGRAFAHRGLTTAALRRLPRRGRPRRPG